MHHIENSQGAGSVEAPALRFDSSPALNSQALNLFENNPLGTDTSRSDSAAMADKGLVGNLTLFDGNDRSEERPVQLANYNVPIKVLPPGPRISAEPIRPIPGQTLPGGGIWRRPLGIGG